MKRTFELIAAAGIAALLTIGYLVYAGRVLGPAEYADFSAALSVIYFFGVALSPIAPTLARIAARRAARREEGAVATLRNAVVRRVVVACGIVVLIAIAAAPAIARWLHFRTAAPLIAAFIAGLLFAIVSADRGVLQGLMLFRSYNANVILEAAIRAGGAIFVLRAMSSSAATALASYVAGLAVAEVVISFSLRRRWRGLEPAPIDWGEIRSLAGPLLLLMIAAAAFQNLDMLAVKRWIPAEDAGRYGAAMTVARSFAVVFVPLYVLSGPLLSTARERGERVVLPAVRLALLYVAICLPALLALALWPETLIGWLFGAGFTGLGSAVVVLSGIVILIHTSLLLVQVSITFDDFRFLAVYAIGVIAEVVGLALFHTRVTEILMVAWVTQVGVLTAVACGMILKRRSWES